MNNTKTTLAAIAAFLIAATLVVGGTFAATTTHPAFAYSKNKGHEGDKNSKNGNTITIQKCEQKASQSGFDNDQEQECANLICTHPGSNATCVSEEEVGAAVTPTTSTSTSGPPIPTPVNTINCNLPGLSQTATTGGGSDAALVVNQCCFALNGPNTTTGATGGTTTGGAQTATNTCTVTVTVTTGATTPGMTTGASVVPLSAMSLKTSEKCISGTSGSLNTGTGRTFDVCVNV